MMGPYYIPNDDGSWSIRHLREPGFLAPGSFSYFPVAVASCSCKLQLQLLLSVQMTDQSRAGGGSSARMLHFESSRVKDIEPKDTRSRLGTGRLQHPRD